MIYETRYSGTSGYFNYIIRTFYNEPAHLHQGFELLVNLSGEIRITVDEQPYLLRENDAVLIFPNQLHQIHSDACHCILCIFPGELVSAYSASHEGDVPVCNQFVPDPLRLELLRRINCDSAVEDIKGALYLMCGCFDRTAEYCPRRYKHGALLHDIFLFVEKNFRGDCSVGALAHQIGYSENYLSRYFMNAIGMSFHSYVIQYRLEQACHMMRNTNEPILRCAMDNGFTSLRSFNRNFNLYIGMTPTEYRENRI